MEPNWTALATAIKKRRTELRFSQDGLANEAGVSRSTIQKLEWATARPEYETLQKVERALGWEPGSADDVLRGSRPKLAGRPLGASEWSEGSSTQPDLATVLNHVVFDLVIAVNPNMTAAEVQALQARALETARRLGVPERPKRLSAHNDDDPEQ